MTRLHELEREHNLGPDSIQRCLRRNSPRQDGYMAIARRTFFDDHPFASRSRERVVAVASDGDGGDACFTHDDRARVHTKEA
jgi:hypothetical protein